MRKGLFAAPVLALLLVVPACGSDDGGDAGATIGSTAPGAVGVDLSGVEFTDLTGQAEVVVEARDNTFRQDHIEVTAGTTVVFRNVGRNVHNVLPAVDGAFTAIEVADFDPGEEASVTFDEPGDFPYYCSLHGTRTKGMVGAVRVVPA